jgi:hypothetical protein
MDYTQPTWAATPTVEYALDVIKDAEEIDRIQIDKAFILIGRSEGCDIQLAHPSVSRFHCVLQYSNDGKLYLYDLGSTQFTYLNKQPVEPKKYHELYTGDILNFAQSTRIYVVDGPSTHVRSEEVKLFDAEGRLKSEISKEYRYKERLRNILEGSKQLPQSEILNKLQDVSWGFAEDASEVPLRDEDMYLYEDKLDIDKVRERPELDKKQLSIIDKIDTLERKRKNLTGEAENIRKKEDLQDEGLTQKQMSRISSIEEKLQDIGNEREILIEKLRESLLDKMPNSPAEKREREDASDEDDLYDNLKKVKMEETYEDIEKILEKLCYEREEVKNLIEELNNAEVENGSDPLEQFYKSNFDELKKDNLAKYAARLDDLNTKIDKIHSELPHVKLKQVPHITRIHPVQPKLSPPSSPPKPKYSYGPTPKPPPRNESEIPSISSHALEQLYGTSSQIPSSSITLSHLTDSWKAPEDQSGDGKTDLNSKYGY